MIKKIVFSVLSILLGLVFILSGLTKLYPIELFELTFIDLGVGTWKTAPFISRLFIAMEFFLGIMLIFNIRLKKFTLKATLGLIIAFTIYLFIQMYFEGNKGNCKCFGNFLVMTPLESIIKNLAMIAVAGLLLWAKHDITYRFQKLLMILGLLASLSLPFILNPPDFIATYQFQEETNEARERFEAVVRMYESNVALVKNYENLANDQQDIIISNTQMMQRLIDKLEAFPK